jgi:exopolyphosphatase
MNRKYCLGIELTNMRTAESTPSQRAIPALGDFLNDVRHQPTRSVVIGNEAGDADTIVSAVALAYVESVKSSQTKTPIVAIPKADLETLSPEVGLLF